MLLGYQYFDVLRGRREGGEWGGEEEGGREKGGREGGGEGGGLGRVEGTGGERREKGRIEEMEEEREGRRGGGEGSRPEAAKNRGYAEVTSCLC